MRGFVLSLLVVATLACYGERSAERVTVMGAGEEGADSTFAQFTAHQLGRLRAGTTLQQWLAAAPRDTVVLADEPGARADTLADAGFCARATLVEHLAGGGTAVRHAYFYPPAPDPRTPLPSAGARARLLRTACTVGVIAASLEGDVESDTVAWLPAFAPGHPAPVSAAAGPGPAVDAPELRALAPGMACTANAAAFHEAVRAAEDRADRTSDPRLAARLHLAVADTYADLIAVSYPPATAAGVAGTPADSSDLDIPEPSGLRSSAAEHYREALALDPTMPEARRAWGTAWRLLAGLRPDRAGC